MTGRKMQVHSKNKRRAKNKGEQKEMKLLHLLTIGALISSISTISAQEAYDPSVPKPTRSEVAYGDHERHVLDFWQARSDQPTPLVMAPLSDAARALQFERSKAEHRIISLMRKNA
jgi:hypothetical protein